MILITKKQYKQMLQNGQKQHEAQEREEIIDFKPVVKLFTPDAGATWLLTEICPNDQDIAFGLCDLGVGFPELGYVSLSEVRELRGKLGLPVERDLYFEANKTLSQYADEAHKARGITA